MSKQDKFIFQISLSVLDHLGRKLYRNFITILGEAISNSWDANAQNVWININSKKGIIVIKDDGLGMSEDDFQYKFLKIGYSKRTDESVQRLERPFIGRKGIGKLALLSCAKRIHVVTKKESAEYVGGIIDNDKLDKAIGKDLEPKNYPLGSINLRDYEESTKDHDQGTILVLEGIKEGIINDAKQLRKLVALYFKFSLHDPDFNIHIDDEIVNASDLDTLVSKTEFLWTINDIKDDSFVQKLQDQAGQQEILPDIDDRFQGFVASVEKPADLNIFGTGEKISIDLFVNGRLRERGIISSITTNRLFENYLYGQIHFDELDKDGDEDRFTTAREGVLDNDPEYAKLLRSLRDKVLLRIMEQWDQFRLERDQDGDPENLRIPLRERRAGELFNAISKQLGSEIEIDSVQNKKLKGWIKSLKGDATLNFDAYAAIFTAENLLRKLIQDKQLSISSEQAEIAKWRGIESANKQQAQLFIDLRLDNDDLFYLNMKSLLDIIELSNVPEAQTPILDEQRFALFRNIVMHTARLTSDSRVNLLASYRNIEAKVRQLLHKI